MNIENITKAANLNKELNRQDHFIELLQEEKRYDKLIVKSQNGYSSGYRLTPEMRQALLDIARKDKDSIINQIEAL